MLLKITNKGSIRIIFILTIIIFLFSPLLVWSAEPLGVPDPELIEYPDEDPPSPGLVNLGKILFFDTRLSLNENQSCGTCHNPDLGFGDGMALGLGTMGERLGRNTPHLYNLAWNVLFFWDGRAESLEEQALGPIQAKGEMNMPLGKLVKKLEKVSYYQRAFQNLFPEKGITSENIAVAIAAFERSIIVKNTPFDQYMKGDMAAISPAALRGLTLFEGKARCQLCHMGPHFTDNGFHNIGIGENDDPGRAKIQAGATAQGAFKTPGLRNSLLTAPYMHDGSIASLEEVIRHYNQGAPQKGLSDLIVPLNLTDKEIIDLLAFLGSLTEPFIIDRPQIP